MTTYKPKIRRRDARFGFVHSYPKGDVALLDNLHRIELPRPLRLLAWLVGLGILFSAIGLWQIPWVQTSHGMGRVTTLDPRDRVQYINAMVSGRLAEWYVRDGQSVVRGQPIARIEDLDAALVDRLDAQLRAARGRLAAAREAVATARIDYERRERLLEQGLTSRFDYEQARIKVQQLLATQEEAEGAVQQAEVNLSRQGSQLVTAPRDGTILHVEAGDAATLVNAGQPLVTFLPSLAERAVELYIDGRDIGLIYPGRHVRLQFEGWPAVQFSGMPDFAIGTFAGEVSFVEPSARSDGTFRVLVKEVVEAEDCEPELRPSLTRVAGNCGWPPESFVRLGTSTRGWILMETVPLGFELWRLLNNFPPVNTIPINGE